MLTNKIKISEKELIDYALKHFKKDNILEISYNRVFIPGKIINIHKKEALITLQLKGELLNQTIEIKLNDIKEELLEIRHTSNENITIISIVN